MREWWSKLLKMVAGRRDLDAELREEIDTHLNFEIQENVERGMTPQAARENAVRKFGNTTLIEERARESWAFCFLETLLRDLRQGSRMLARNPVFTATAVLSLALGIGANAALFSVFNAVMMRLLPVREPERLALLTWGARTFPEKVVEDVEGSFEKDKKSGLMVSNSFSFACYETLGRANTVCSALIASASNDDRINIGLGGRAQDAMMQSVSGNYFEGLGITAALGRVLRPEDDQSAAPPVAVVSYSFWRRSLGGDPSVIGGKIAINGQAAAIVGVAPREFFGVEPGRAPDLYVPLSFNVRQYIQNHDYDLQQRKVWWLTIIGRLKPGVSLERADHELKVLFQQSLDVGGEMPGDVPRLQLLEASRGLNDLREEFSTSLLLLMSMVGLVLLIACTNVAGLLLARATARRREISVRLSLGAPRLRIVRQLLTESILLGALGGAAGLPFAAWVGSTLVALFESAPRQRIVLSVHPDLRVLAFTAGLSVMSGILFGLSPALRASHPDIYSTLRQPAGVPASAGRRVLSGRFLVGAQVSLALLMLVCAGLLVGTLQLLQRTDLGFNRQQLLVFEVQPGLNGYKGERLASYYRDLQHRIEAIPGVRAAGLSQRGLIGEGWSQGRVVIPGYTAPGKGVPFYRHWVSSGFFETLEIPLILGRVIEAGDLKSAPRAVVVNQKFVREYLHGDNPIGRQFKAGGESGEIVGVVGDARYASLRDAAPPTAYLSYLQYPRDYPESMKFEVRTYVAPDIIAPQIRAEAAALDKEIPVIQMRTETQIIDQALFLEKVFALLSSSFGFLALVLACIGLYGAMSYQVARRTNEIGIRLALGARREEIIRLVLGETLCIVLAGIAVGLPLAWLAARLLKNQLFGLSPHDPGTIVLATVAVLTVTVGAGFLPAVRASRVDPLVALRHE